MKGACALVSRSVEHSATQVAAAEEYDQGVRAVELGSYYLMEPCGSGRSRLTYICRTDLRYVGGEGGGRRGAGGRRRGWCL